MTWQDAAACRGMAATVFFAAPHKRGRPRAGRQPEPTRSTNEAKAICANCAVATQCLDYAIDHREDHGIWGGTTGRERRRIAWRRGLRWETGDTTNESD